MKNETIEQIYYVPVSVKDKPKNIGWYNMESDAQPSACGICWFDGKEFQLSNQSNDFKTLLANGFQLFWLEKRTLPIPELSDEEIKDMAWATCKNSEEMKLIRDGAKLYRDHIRRLMSK